MTPRNASPEDVETGRQALAAWIVRLQLRSSLDEDDRATLIDLPFNIERIAANRDFVRLGERSTHACLIIEGWAARFGQTGDGNRLITAIHLPGDMCDLHSVVAPRAASALTALSPATIVKVPHPALKTAADARPAIARALWRDCVADGLTLSEWVLNIGRRAAAPRLAHLICELAVRLAAIGIDKGTTFAFPITQAHLGDATGLTPVHVNRMLRDLRDAELITIRDRTATILDWPALVELADFRPDYLHLHQSTVAEVQARLVAA